MLDHISSMYRMALKRCMEDVEKDKEVKHTPFLYWVCSVYCKHLINEAASWAFYNY
jgi:hypothetical protein